MSFGIGVDLRQQAARQGDVDLLCVARREAAGKIRHCHAEADAIIRMQNHGKAHDLLLFPIRLLLDAVQRTGGNVAVRVLDRHQAQ